MNRGYIAFIRILCATAIVALQLALSSEVSSAFNRQVFSFGSNGFGQTGLGTSTGSTLVPTPIDPSTFINKTITAIAAQHGQVESHSLLADSEGRVYAFGRNSDGRTGQGTTSGNTLIATPIVSTNLSGKRIKQVTGGIAHSLLLADDGTVFGMGATGLNGLPSGSGIATTAKPIDTSNLAGRQITQVAAGMFHNLLLAEDGTVFSFGVNEFGRTGLGFESGNTFIATQIDMTNLGGRKINEIAAGGLHSLLLTEDGAVFSFGWNGFGATGHGTNSGSTLIATQIITSHLDGKRIVHIAAGGGNSLLVADDGTVFSFGDNSFGKTGLGISSGRTTIATLIDTTNLAGEHIEHVSVGGGHSLLLSEDGDVFTFGSNSFGRTGLGTTSGETLIATSIDSSNWAGRRVTAVAAGFNHSLLLTVPEPSVASLSILGVVWQISVTRRRRHYRTNRSAV